MTTSEVTSSDQRQETWKPVPGFSKYEAGDLGHVRSAATGRVLAAQMSNSGYLLVKVYDDEGKRQTRTLHSLILVTFAGERPDGQQARHLNDDQNDNRWPENLCWGTREQNVADRMVNNPAKPKPQKLCVRCSEPFTGNGRRCHDCVVAIGQEAARLLRSGVPLGTAAEQLSYPSVEGLHTLAVKYGGYGVERPRWTQKVTATVRRLFPGGDAK